MSRNGPWLSIVGLGADGLTGLSEEARARLAGAEVLVGGDRHLALVGGPAEIERFTWEFPLTRTVERIADNRGRPVVVLATGDPMWFGVGVTLVRHFAPEEWEILPHLSAFSLAASRLGWPIAECECVTAHGRPLDLIRRHVYPGARLLILSEDGQTPVRLAALLTEIGYGTSQMIVLSELGSDAEARIEGPARSWSGPDVAPLNTIAVLCCPDAANTPVLSRLPGLPDDVFEHDGQMTKQAVRAATFALLAPLPGELLWDVGAGSGSIAVEWLRAVPRGHAIAIERKPARVQRIRRNATQLGVPDLRIAEGAAPSVLQDLPAPDVVFVGGGASTPGVMEACWTALKQGGRLVANAVTLDSEAVLLDWHARHGGDLLRIAVSRAEPVGPYHGWRPLMPVTQYCLKKDRA